MVPAVETGCGIVSIRSRRLSAGEAVSGSGKLISARTFQSAPADCRREKHFVQLCLCEVFGFNPLPPTVGGRRSRG